MRFYAVMDDGLEETIELFVEQGEAELVVEAWDRDEPDRAGEIRVERNSSRSKRRRTNHPDW